MFKTLKRLYDIGLLNKAGLDKAVIKGWIKEEEKQLILG